MPRMVRPPRRRPGRTGITTKDGRASGSVPAASSCTSRVVEEHEVQDDVQDRRDGDVDPEPLLPSAPVAGALVLCGHRSLLPSGALFGTTDVIPRRMCEIPG